MVSAQLKTAKKGSNPMTITAKNKPKDNESIALLIDIFPTSYRPFSSIYMYVYA